MRACCSSGVTREEDHEVVKVETKKAGVAGWYVLLEKVHIFVKSS